MSFKHYLLSAGAVVALSIQSCGGSAPDPSTPGGSVMSSVEAMKSNDASAYLDSVLSVEQQAKLAVEWDDKRKNDAPSEAENQQFAEQMEKLVSGQMIEEVMPMVEAQLAQINKEQIAGMLGMMGGSIMQSPDMTDEQKMQAQALMTSLNQWVLEADITNPENVRKVLVIAQNAAKKLNIKDLKQATALTFDQLVDKGDIIIPAIKDALNVYGINLDDTLNSVSVDNVSVNGDTADVTISYTMFGTKQTMVTKMKKDGNRWFDSTSSSKLEEALK